MSDQDYGDVFSPDDPDDVHGKIMLSAIISLSLVIAIVLIVHIYARFVLHRQARRRQQLALEAAQLHSTCQPPSGLDTTAIASLPIFRFRQLGRLDQGKIVECAVCLSTLEGEQMARLLPNCKHNFHAECIDKWLGSHSTCPICRTEAVPWLMPEPREPPAGPPPIAPPLAWEEGKIGGSNLD
ncbi:hypothetical protein Nepgr_000386 [Nepenthes gracilis]|uniref:RING-type E3 ubiquitin transferase n=1 Tax=Nepenthes gracilis TaxID=150966 RepID=A0AAD3RVF2_NEPGR|nr:hypothetical protein Nepgr_000386 [Nepenthes gracilis]